MIPAQEEQVKNIVNALKNADNSQVVCAALKKIHRDNLLTMAKIIECILESKE